MYLLGDLFVNATGYSHMRTALIFIKRIISMTFHPLSPDLSKLTDDELHEKRGELQNRLAFSYRMGYSNLVGQLQLLMNDYSTEVERRNTELMNELQQKNNKNHQDKIQIG